MGSGSICTPIPKLCTDPVNSFIHQRHENPALQQTPALNSLLGMFARKVAPKNYVVHRVVCNHFIIFILFSNVKRWQFLDEIVADTWDLLEIKTRTRSNRPFSLRSGLTLLVQASKSGLSDLWNSKTYLAFSSDAKGLLKLKKRDPLKDWNTKYIIMDTFVCKGKLIINLKVIALTGWIYAKGFEFEMIRSERLYVMR